MDTHIWLNIINFGLVILIWLVQLIIYPSFVYVAEDDFIKWHRRYVKTISCIVSPMMLIQMGLVVLLLLSHAEITLFIMLICITTVWISSFSLSVPCHKILSRSGKDKVVIIRLVRTNWIRTVLWTVVFLTGILFQV